MFTQYDTPIKATYEVSSSDSLVSDVPVQSNAARIAQMQLTGLMVDAVKLGYDFGQDDDIPAVINARAGRYSDVLDMLDYMAHLHEQISAMVSSKLDNRPTDAVKQEEPSKSTAVPISTDSGQATEVLPQTDK